MSKTEEEELFELEQQLDIPYKDRYYQKYMKSKPCTKTMSGEHKWKKKSLIYKPLEKAGKRIKIADPICLACGMIDDRKEGK